MRHLAGVRWLLTTAAVVAIVYVPCYVTAAEPDAPKTPPGHRIRPWDQNPWYWQYEGQPVLLLGGSKDDNLFQIPDLKEHLDDIAGAGGNYIRNTMSDRRDGGFEVYPFRQLVDGRYDLDKFNDEYWRRFDNLLRWTHERKIIVQIEIWDRFDYSREHWPLHPYNPQNNVNYTSDESGLAPKYPDHPGRNRQPFFFTTPKQRDNRAVLPRQQRFVRELLRRSLPWPHVLYCIDNETNGDEAWSTYWADFVRKQAQEAGVEAYVTEMWDAHDLKAAEHLRTFSHPERYAFVDISQNNHQKGQVHWDNFQWVRSQLGDRPRPINTVKTYGADGNKFGHTDRDGIERWWRHLVGGAAAVRFHRPDSGLGFSPKAEASIRSGRLLESCVKLWDLAPAIERLRNRQANEAYAAVRVGHAAVVYFPNGGDVELDLEGFPAACQVRWLNVERAALDGGKPIRGGEWTKLQAPGGGHWVAIIGPTSLD